MCCYSVFVLIPWHLISSICNERVPWFGITLIFSVRVCVFCRPLFRSGINVKHHYWICYNFFVLLLMVFGKEKVQNIWGSQWNSMVLTYDFLSCSVICMNFGFNSNWGLSNLRLVCFDHFYMSIDIGFDFDEYNLIISWRTCFSLFLNHVRFLLHYLQVF